MATFFTTIFLFSCCFFFYYPHRDRRTTKICVKRVLRGRGREEKNVYFLSKLLFHFGFHFISFYIYLFFCFFFLTIPILPLASSLSLSPYKYKIYNIPTHTIPFTILFCKKNYVIKYFLLLLLHLLTSIIITFLCVARLLNFNRFLFFFNLKALCVCVCVILENFFER